MTLQATAPGRATTRPGRPGRGRRYRRLLPLVPAIVLLLIFFTGPMIWAFYTATTNSALTGVEAVHPQSVGLDNFKNALADSDVHDAVGRTLVFVIACVIGQNGLGLGLAFLMQHRRRSIRALVSAIVVGAWVIPEIVAAFIWYSYLQPDGGTLNQIINLLGLPGQSWLVTSPLVSVILANVWRGSAFSMLIYSAGLQDVPADLIDAASVDGASATQRTWHVVLPTMRRTIAANLVLTTLATLGVFGLIWAMTAGGPANHSTTLPVLMYTEAFSFGQLGYGSAISIIILAIGALFSIAYLFFLRGDRR